MENTLKSRKFVENMSVWPLCTGNTSFSRRGAVFVHGTPWPSTGMLSVLVLREALAFWIPNLISLSWCLLLCFWGFYFYKKTVSWDNACLCAHLSHSFWLCFKKGKKKLPLYTLRGEGQVLCGKVLKGAAQGYLVIIRGKFLIVYHMLVNFITKIFTFWNNLQEQSWCAFLMLKISLFSSSPIIFFIFFFFMKGCISTKLRDSGGYFIYIHIFQI